MNRRFQKGLTLIELLVAIGILLILFTLTTMNLSRLPSSTAQSSGYDLLISDLRSQQTKAMSGYNSDAGAISGNAYGVHFESTSYVLFRGSAYSPSDVDNFLVTLEPNLSFTGSTLPTSNGNSIVFSQGSGDIANYISGQDGISLSNSFTGDVKVIRLNKYG